jgi:6-phosphogluconolactonase
VRLRTYPDVAVAAARAADLVVAHARAALAARGRFLLGLSGGKGPGPFFAELAGRDVDWSGVWVVQVDERIAPDGDRARNDLLIRERFGAVVDQFGGFVPVPVDPDRPEHTAAAYRDALVGLAGNPPVLDLVQLGLGPDGHTASLVPGDPVVDQLSEPVAVTGLYEGHRRVTLTRPVLNAARHRLWFVTGASKRQPLARLLHHDAGIPAGLVRADHTTVVADRAAVGLSSGAVDVPTPAG